MALQTDVARQHRHGLSSWLGSTSLGHCIHTALLKHVGPWGQLSLLHEAKVRTMPAWMTSRSNRENWPRGSSLQFHRGSPPRVSLYPAHLLSNCPHTVHNVGKKAELSFRLPAKPSVILHLLSQPSVTCPYLKENATI